MPGASPPPLLPPLRAGGKFAVADDVSQAGSVLGRAIVAAEGLDHQDKAPDDGSGEDDVASAACRHGGVVAQDRADDSAAAQQESGEQAPRIHGGARLQAEGVLIQSGVGKPRVGPARSGRRRTRRWRRRRERRDGWCRDRRRCRDDFLDVTRGAGRLPVLSALLSAVLNH